MMRRYCVLCLAVLVAMPVVAGERIYKWVDEQGVTHYSEELPDDRSENDVESLDTDAFAPAIIRSEADHYSVVNQAKRMEQQRLAREAERDAEADARRQAALVEAQTAAAEAAARRADAERVIEPPSYLLVKPPPLVFVPQHPHLPPPAGLLPEAARAPHAVERLADGPGQTAQRPQRTLHRIDAQAHGPYPDPAMAQPPTLFPW